MKPKYDAVRKQKSSEEMGSTGGIVVQMMNRDFRLAYSDYSSLYVHNMMNQRNANSSLELYLNFLDQLEAMFPAPEYECRREDVREVEVPEVEFPDEKYPDLQDPNARPPVCQDPNAYLDE